MITIIQTDSPLDAAVGGTMIHSKVGSGATRTNSLINSRLYILTICHRITPLGTHYGHLSLASRSRQSNSLGLREILWIFAFICRIPG